MNKIILLILILIVIYIYFIVNGKNKIIFDNKTGSKIVLYNEENEINKEELLKKIIDNMYILRQHMIDNIENFPEYKDYINLLKKNLTPIRTTIYETDPYSEFTSYSVNKGEELSICLTSKKTKELHNINILMYVVIHELAHMACPEIGHGILFKKIFKKLLEEAIKINIYNYENYNEQPLEYCGMTINSNII